MNKLTRWAMLALALTLLAPVAADAKIRIRSGGSSENLVKVRDLPDVPQLLHQSGDYIDLGYFWKRNKDGAWEGAWVGLLGTSRYLKLSRPQLRSILKTANLNVLPAPPPKPKERSTGRMVFYVIAGLGLLVIIYQQIGHFRQSRRRS